MGLAVPARVARAACANGHWLEDGGGPKRCRSSSDGFKECDITLLDSDSSTKTSIDAAE